MNYPRIYADYNGIQISPRNISRSAVPLDTFGSLKELSNAGIRLQNEMMLIIYDYSDEAEDLESNVVIYWNTRRKVWLAEIIDEEIIYIPKRETNCNRISLLEVPFATSGFHHKTWNE